MCSCALFGHAYSGAALRSTTEGREISSFGQISLRVGVGVHFDSLWATPYLPFFFCIPGAAEEGRRWGRKRGVSRDGDFLSVEKRVQVCKKRVLCVCVFVSFSF